MPNQSRHAIYLVASIILVCISSSHSQGVIRSSRKAVIRDTVTSLAGYKKQIVFLKVSEKKVYKMQRIDPSVIVHGENEGKMGAVQMESAPLAKHPYYNGAIDCSGELFAGTDRAVPKTHLVSAPIEVFASVDELLGKLKSDDEMRNHNPIITKDPESERVEEENKNVVINEAFIYGIYREKDNDFHIILGNGKPGAGMRLINIEVAGLPDSGDELKKVRDKIITRFGDISCNDGAFKPVGTLIPVKVTGSLFYDIDHAPGIVGFGIFKPKKSWEIHPVKDIIFMDHQ